MKKSELLEALSKIKPKSKKVIRKDAVLESLKNYKKPDKGGITADAIIKMVENSPEFTKLESEWKPKQTDVKELSNRIIYEAEMENNKPNAFRLNLTPIVLDVTHGKFQATRNGKTAIFELLYPNANGKITVKVQVEGSEDKILEIGLEDPEYLGNLGAYIIKLIDQSVAESDDGQQEEMDDYLYSGGDYATGPSAGLGKGAFPSNWGAMGESDMQKINSLIEQGFNKDEDVDELEEEVDSLEGGEGEEGQEQFGEDDFSIGASDVGTEAGDFASEFGGDFSGGGGGSGADFGEEGGPESMNAEDDGQISMEDEVTYMTFRDKSDWLNSSLDTMQKLVSQSVAGKMQDGSGVIMTSDEILNGTVGIKGDNNYDVIDKFLKVYTELDSIDLTEDQLNQIEDKLSMDDGQFDAWLQQNLPEFSGQEEVNETLNNEMFDDFEPMGGEEVPEEGAPVPPTGEFDELVDKAMSEEDEVTPESKEAEIAVGGTETEEFPGLSSEDEEPKKK